MLLTYVLIFCRDYDYCNGTLTRLNFLVLNKILGQSNAPLTLPHYTDIYNVLSQVHYVMLLRGETGYNTTALIELVQVQGAHGKTTRPLRLMGHLKRLHHISALSRKQTFLISKQSKVQSL